MDEKTLAPGNALPAGGVRNFSCALKVSKSIPDIAASVSNLGLSSLSISGGALEISQVTGKDVGGNMANFIRLRISPGLLEADYSCLAGENPARRKMEAVSFALHVLCASGACSSWQRGIFQLASSSLAEAAEGISGTQDSILARLEELNSEHESLKRKYSAAISENESRGQKLRNLSARLDSAIGAVKGLKIVPDDVADAEIMEHLATHGGKIDMRKFCLEKGMPPSVVEAGLNRLSIGGHIARVN